MIGTVRMRANPPEHPIESGVSMPSRPRPRAADWPYFAGPRPLALAHRGGAAYGPNVGIENSLAAFANAVGLGYSHVETDVHATADGVAVAFHDSRLDRVTDAAGAIGDLPWAAVSQARIGGREPIPTLAATLEAFPELNLNIDLKSDAVVEPALRAIQAAGAERRVCLGSFDERRIRRAHRLAGGRIAVSYSTVGTLAVKIARPVGLARVLAGPGVALQIPETFRGVNVLTERLVGRAHAIGKDVHVWTIDDAGDMERLLDLGVDGIVSDRPDVLRDVLIARGAWDR
jgi:glycerophosphoryl diester phosphodiesterase